MSAPFGLAVMVTNWIPNSFVQSCHESKLFYLTAAYSRQLNTANKFISETPSIKDASRVEAYNDLDTMLSKGSNIDVVYIASPNSLHCEQGVKALNAGKHVIMQKPFASNMKELEALYELADSKVTSSWKLIGTFKSPTSRDFRDYLMMRKPEQRSSAKSMARVSRWLCIRRCLEISQKTTFQMLHFPSSVAAVCGIWVAILSHSLSDSLENPPSPVDRNTAILVKYKPIEGQIKQ
ncbi:hypothetical protein IWW34DRAFT_762186 [Fusarium oxysporum f. sp. albedinis]|nr:hypothetical protein IWW34DRAFT_762186 [Fusarium oxysporum f. sp. albedinis]KAK2470059.1 hypothetical protein H9L39_18207 [Fusarium oxysporum f. sp. albedinis]